MVLTDDDFETIINAVREGRRVYANIKKSIDFLLPTSYGLGLIVFISILLGLTMPMRPVQILWINMVTAITLSFAFVYEPADPDIMNRPPRPKETGLVDSYEVFRLVYVAIFLAGASVFANYWLINNGYSVLVASTVTVNSIAIADMFYMFNIRAQNGFAFKKGFFDNKIAFAVSFTLILLQLFLTYVPFMQTIFKTEAVEWQLWSIPFGIGSVLFILVEIEKTISRIRRNK
ncbi:cation transporting ATPase C-terminal domain-containing protein [Lacticigenium naphthae]|uniref:cation transporting ATPase C-terminal domain-containing protein n=1 Tax=Lacticigenium naphthae TaxID=515351 RepID=UPI00040D8EF0|nr:cation transporting ATPase C-terminal domain-containing protein [Lacticigenium naphthae]